MADGRVRWCLGIVCGLLREKEGEKRDGACVAVVFYQPHKSGLLPWCMRRRLPEANVMHRWCEGSVGSCPSAYSSTSSPLGSPPRLHWFAFLARLNVSRSALVSCLRHSPPGVSPARQFLPSFEDFGRSMMWPVSRRMSLGVRRFESPSGRGLLPSRHPARRPCRPIAACRHLAKCEAW